MNKELEQEEINFAGKITPEIFLRLQYLHLGWSRFAGFSFIPVLVAIVMSEKPDWKVVGILFITIIVVAAIMLWWQKKNLLRIYKKSPYLHDYMEGSVSQNSLKVKNNTGQSDLQWSDFIKTKYTDDLVLLYRGPNLMNFLVREFFYEEVAWKKAITIIKDRTLTKQRI
jgi:hypothetical protein